MSNWSVRAVISLSIAVACARASDDDLIPSGEDGTGGKSGSAPFGGASGFGGAASGGTSARGGATTGGSITGGAAATGGATSTGGRGGTTSGGTDAGGASDGGEGPDACAPGTSPPALHLDYQAGMKPVTEDPEGEFRIVNDSDAAVSLSDLTVRYWFHSEFTCNETTDRMTVNVVVAQLGNPFADFGTANVTKEVIALGPAASGCDAYFELGFTSAAGSLSKAQYAVVRYFAQIPIYDRAHDQSNDYSYGACLQMPVYFERVTLYRDDRLVSGREPGAGGEGGAGGENAGGMGGV